MGTTRNAILSQVLISTAATLIASGAISLVTWIRQGLPWLWLSTVREWPLGAVAVFALTWTVAARVAARQRMILALNARAQIRRNALFGWKNLRELEHAGVLWIMRVPKGALDMDLPPPYGRSASRLLDEVEASFPPRCPKCRTELEERALFMGGFTWRCVACDFRKRNKESYWSEHERAAKIGRRIVESDLERRGR
jgi:ribosomal protein L37AE/L43A